MLDALHIEDNFLHSCTDQTFQLFTQSITLLAEHNPAVQRQNRSAPFFADRHLRYQITVFPIAVTLIV